MTSTNSIAAEEYDVRGRKGAAALTLTMFLNMAYIFRQSL